MSSGQRFLLQLKSHVVVDVSSSFSPQILKPNLSTILLPRGNPHNPNVHASQSILERILANELDMLSVLSVWGPQGKNPGRDNGHNTLPSGSQLEKLAREALQLGLASQLRAPVIIARAEGGTSVSLERWPAALTAVAAGKRGPTEPLLTARGRTGAPVRTSAPTLLGDCSWGQAGVPEADV